MDKPLSLDQAFIKKLTDIILANLKNEHFGVEELSRFMGMSHSTIHRKLRSYTNRSLIQFIREIRLQKAHEMLKQNLSGDADNQYFADGVTADLRDHLSRIRGLKVISGTTSEHFRGSTLTIPEIAKKLGVNYILEGSTQEDNNRTRVSVKLIDAKSDLQLLSETLDRELRDIFSVQSEIAQNVAGKLEAVLSAEEIEQIEKIPTKSTEAHINYLKGRYSWSLRTKESLMTSIKYFEKSIAEDPSYALAYTGLADAYYFQARNHLIPTAEGFRKAKEIAQKALDIDPSLAEAHAIIGGVYAWGDWQWEKARRARTND
jgi:TolB-like protein